MKRNKRFENHYVKMLYFGRSNMQKPKKKRRRRKRRRKKKVRELPLSDAPTRYVFAPSTGSGIYALLHKAASKHPVLNRNRKPQPPIDWRENPMRFKRVKPDDLPPKKADGGDPQYNSYSTPPPEPPKDPVKIALEPSILQHQPPLHDAIPEPDLPPDTPPGMNKVPVRTPPIQNPIGVNFKSFNTPFHFPDPALPIKTPVKLDVGPTPIKLDVAPTPIKLDVGPTPIKTPFSRIKLDFPVKLDSAPAPVKLDVAPTPLPTPLKTPFSRIKFDFPVKTPFSRIKLDFPVKLDSAPAPVKLDVEPTPTKTKPSLFQPLNEEVPQLKETHLRVKLAEKNHLRRAPIITQQLKPMNEPVQMDMPLGTTTAMPIFEDSLTRTSAPPIIEGPKAPFSKSVNEVLMKLKDPVHDSIVKLKEPARFVKSAITSSVSGFTYDTKPIVPIYPDSLTRIDSYPLFGPPDPTSLDLLKQSMGDSIADATSKATAALAKGSSNVLEGTASGFNFAKSSLSKASSQGIQYTADTFNQMSDYLKQRNIDMKDPVISTMDSITTNMETEIPYVAPVKTPLIKPDFYFLRTPYVPIKLNFGPTTVNHVIPTPLPDTNVQPGPLPYVAPAKTPLIKPDFYFLKSPYVPIKLNFGPTTDATPEVQPEPLPYVTPAPARVLPTPLPNPTPEAQPEVQPEPLPYVTPAPARILPNPLPNPTPEAQPEPEPSPVLSAPEFASYEKPSDSSLQRTEIPYEMPHDFETPEEHQNRIFQRIGEAIHLLINTFDKSIRFSVEAFRDYPDVIVYTVLFQIVVLFSGLDVNPFGHLIGMSTPLRSMLMSKLLIGLGFVIRFYEDFRTRIQFIGDNAMNMANAIREMGSSIHTKFRNVRHTVFKGTQNMRRTIKKVKLANRMARDTLSEIPAAQSIKAMTINPHSIYMKGSEIGKWIVNLREPIWSATDDYSRSIARTALHNTYRATDWMTRTEFLLRNLVIELTRGSKELMYDAFTSSLDVIYTMTLPQLSDLCYKLAKVLYPYAEKAAYTTASLSKDLVIHLGKQVPPAIQYVNEGIQAMGQKLSHYVGQHAPNEFMLKTHKTIEQTIVEPIKTLPSIVKQGTITAIQMIKESNPSEFLLRTKEKMKNQVPRTDIVVNFLDRLRVNTPWFANPGLSQDLTNLEIPGLMYTSASPNEVYNPFGLYIEYIHSNIKSVLDWKLKQLEVTRILKDHTLGRMNVLRRTAMRSSVEKKFNLIREQIHEISQPIEIFLDRAFIATTLLSHEWMHNERLNPTLVPISPPTDNMFGGTNVDIESPPPPRFAMGELDGFAKISFTELIEKVKEQMIPQLNALRERNAQAAESAQIVQNYKEGAVQIVTALLPLLADVIGAVIMGDLSLVPSLGTRIYEIHTVGGIVLGLLKLTRHHQSPWMIDFTQQFESALHLYSNVQLAGSVARQGANLMGQIQLTGQMNQLRQRAEDLTRRGVNLDFFTKLQKQYDLARTKLGIPQSVLATAGLGQKKYFASRDPYYDPKRNFVLKYVPDFNFDSGKDVGKGPISAGGVAGSPGGDPGDDGGGDPPDPRKPANDNAHRNDANRPKPKRKSPNDESKDQPQSEDTHDYKAELAKRPRWAPPEPEIINDPTNNQDHLRSKRPRSKNSKEEANDIHISTTPDTNDYKGALSKRPDLKPATTSSSATPHTQASESNIHTLGSLPEETTPAPPPPPPPTEPTLPQSPIPPNNGIHSMVTLEDQQRYNLEMEQYNLEMEHFRAHLRYLKQLEDDEASAMLLKILNIGGNAANQLIKYFRPEYETFEDVYNEAGELYDNIFKDLFNFMGLPDHPELNNTIASLELENVTNVDQFLNQTEVDIDWEQSLLRNNDLIKPTFSLEAMNLHYREVFPIEKPGTLQNVPILTTHFKQTLQANIEKISELERLTGYTLTSQWNVFPSNLDAWDELDVYMQALGYDADDFGVTYNMELQPDNTYQPKYSLFQIKGLYIPEPYMDVVNEWLVPYVEAIDINKPVELSDKELKYYGIYSHTNNQPNEWKREVQNVKEWHDPKTGIPSLKTQKEFNHWMDRHGYLRSHFIVHDDKYIPVSGKPLSIEWKRNYLAWVQNDDTK